MTNIEKAKTFQERMKDRIRESIGELMTDEELSEIVRRATEEIFFKPVKEKHGMHEKEHPPFIHQLLKELLEDSVKKEINRYLKENQEIVNEKIRKTVERGMGTALINAITDRFRSELIQFEETLTQNLNQY